MTSWFVSPETGLEVRPDRRWAMSWMPCLRTAATYSSACLFPLRSARAGAV